MFCSWLFNMWPCYVNKYISCPTMGRWDRLLRLNPRSETPTSEHHVNTRGGYIYISIQINFGLVWYFLWSQLMFQPNANTNKLNGLKSISRIIKTPSNYPPPASGLLFRFALSMSSVCFGTWVWFESHSTIVEHSLKRHIESWADKL